MPRAAILLAALALSGLPADTRAEFPEGLDDVSSLAEKARADHGVPGIALAAVVDGKIRAAGFAGVRKRGEENPAKIELHDRFHIGSLTKSFTATLAAALVESGRIRWESKPQDFLRLPDLNPGFADLTLKHLLSNSGGLPTDVPAPIWRSAWNARGNFKSIRLDFARSMLALDPLFTPGSKFTYSNAGFGVAGAMLEARTDEGWEALVQKHIFIPLEMTHSGFRAPAADPGNPDLVRDQPWGHRENGTPVPPEPFGDNPPAIAPAGAIHCSILDLAKYARFHLLKTPAPVLKNASSFEALHSPHHRSYALGWSSDKRAWARGDTLNHLGSNTMFYAAIWIAPNANFAAVSVSNIGGDPGQKATDQAVASLVERYLLAPPPAPPR